MGAAACSVPHLPYLNLHSLRSVSQHINCPHCQCSLYPRTTNWGIEEARSGALHQHADNSISETERYYVMTRTLKVAILHPFPTLSILDPSNP